MEVIELADKQVHKVEEEVTRVVTEEVKEIVGEYNDGSVLVAVLCCAGRWRLLWR